MFIVPYLFMFIFGLLVGSFLNVVVLRHGFTEIRRSRSSCQACLTPLRWYELIPVFSFAFLKGRCRSCGSALSWQYPAVEIISGLLFAFTFSVSVPLGSLLSWVSFLFVLVFLSLFLVITTYDLRHTLVPIIFSVPFIASAFLIRALDALQEMGVAPLFDAFLGAILLGGFIALVVALTKGRGMGEGDIYIASAIGLLFGVVRGIEVMMLSFWIGAAVGIVILVFKKGATMKSEVPFVPFMFVATLLGLFTNLSPFSLVAELIGSFVL